MSDATPIPEGPFEQFEEPSPGKPGLLADPVVRAMIYALIGLIILFLVTAISVLVTGVLTTNGPRSSAEQQLLMASSQAQGAAGEAAAPYINALIAAGDLPAARLALDAGSRQCAPPRHPPPTSISQRRGSSARRRTTRRPSPSRTRP